IRARSRIRARSSRARNGLGSMNVNATGNRAAGPLHHPAQKREIPLLRRGRNGMCRADVRPWAHAPESFPRRTCDRERTGPVSWLEAASLAFPAALRCSATPVAFRASHTGSGSSPPGLSQWRGRAGLTPDFRFGPFAYVSGGRIVKGRWGAQGGGQQAASPLRIPTPRASMAAVGDKRRSKGLPPLALESPAAAVPLPAFMPDLAHRVVGGEMVFLT